MKNILVYQKSPQRKREKFEYVSKPTEGTVTKNPGCLTALSNVLQTYRGHCDQESGLLNLGQGEGAEQEEGGRGRRRTPRKKQNLTHRGEEKNIVNL